MSTCASRDTPQSPSPVLGLGSVRQVVIRVRPMFDVELQGGQNYAVQIAKDDPHRLEARAM